MYNLVLKIEIASAIQVRRIAGCAQFVPRSKKSCMPLGEDRGEDLQSMPCDFQKP
jgi:hypothetical protein